jgi:hypothetical protein
VQLLVWSPAHDKIPSVISITTVVMINISSKALARDQRTWRKRESGAAHKSKRKHFLFRRTLWGKAKPLW